MKMRKCYVIVSYLNKESRTNLVFTCYQESRRCPEFSHGTIPCHPNLSGFVDARQMRPTAAKLKFKK